MPFFIPIIITIALSITAINLSYNGNVLGTRDFLDKGKVLGVTETAPGKIDVLQSGKDKFDGAVAKGLEGMGKLSDASGLPAGRLLGTLPQNQTANNEPVKSSGALDPDMPCQGSIAVDLKSDKMLFGKNTSEAFSIASISKLMTALVFMDYNPGWDKVYEIKPEDMREGGVNHIFPGEKVKVRDLLYTSLIASDNSAAISLVGSTGMSEEEFVGKLNEKAEKLGLKNTHFKDPIGLLDDNKSTAEEVAKFAQAALSNQDIKKATLTRKYEFTTEQGKQKIIMNTDDLLSEFPRDGVKINGGKTGYTEAAGYCFVGEFTNQEGHDVISVVLGSGDKDARFKLTHDLIGWVFKSFKW